MRTTVSRQIPSARRGGGAGDSPWTAAGSSTPLRFLSRRPSPASVRHTARCQPRDARRRVTRRHISVRFSRAFPLSRPPPTRADPPLSRPARLRNRSLRLARASPRPARRRRPHRERAGRGVHVRRVVRAGRAVPRGHRAGQVRHEDHGVRLPVAGAVRLGAGRVQQIRQPGGFVFRNAVPGNGLGSAAVRPAGRGSVPGGDVHRHGEPERRVSTQRLGVSGVLLRRRRRRRAVRGVHGTRGARRAPLRLLAESAADGRVVRARGATLGATRRGG